MKVNADYIDEPNLIFGDHKEEKDPRLGLNYHKPFTYSNKNTPIPLIKIGIIKNTSYIEKCKQIIKLISREVPSKESNK